MSSDTRDGNMVIRQLLAVDREQLPTDGGELYNRLIFSASPYLLQHAENPVDWYPWGEEAFARALREDKPVFLSIGYATCHWCHVMAHESFADNEVAAFLNRHFIAIKVDREERPDIDDQYMAVAQLMTGGGGWPLTIVMLPDKRPFYAATYLSKLRRHGMPGLLDVLSRINDLWRTERSRLEQHCTVVMDGLREAPEVADGQAEPQQLADQATAQLTRLYDTENGGFGTAPKFPMPLYHLFLLQRWRTTGDVSLQEMVSTTLYQMRFGGIYDQIGFGFHRYSVDRQWLVPHFEKMLYDQALMALVYLEAGKDMDNTFFVAVAEEILAFVLRDLALPDGGYACALDADSEGREGACYLWTPASVTAAVGEEAEQCCRLFDVSSEGDFEGESILHLSRSLPDMARQWGMTPDALAAAVDRWRQKLLNARSARIQPLRDEKVLTAWNGLSIAALANGYAVTGNQTYLHAAEDAVAFVRTHLTDGEGWLMRSWFAGRVSVPGFLEDYAFFGWGLLELYRATGGSDWLAAARSVADRMLALFGSAGTGRLLDSAGEELLVSRSSLHDGVIPSGTAVAVMILRQLGTLCGEESYLRRSRAIVTDSLCQVAHQPISAIYLLMNGLPDTAPG
ncbi:MAG: DUF255 domain-containing protein [Geobacter sp.]|nr:DUF255 domain-containing protein [Geobacter sp.]